LKLEVDPDEITEEKQLFGPDGLDLDSIDVLELVVGIKKEFGVEIADRQVAEKVFITVGTVAQFIDENR
jgi:acyl carrier protein